MGSGDTYRPVVDEEPVGVLEAEEIMEAASHRQEHSQDGRTPLWTTLKLYAGAAPTWDCASGFHLRVAVGGLDRRRPPRWPPGRRGARFPGASFSPPPLP